MPAVSNDRDRVLQSTDIVRLVGDHVALRPKGKEFLGLCPFHDDKSPSMYVSPAKQIFKCFACGAGGSAFDFVMKYHKLDFVEALKFLAERGGVELQGPSRRRDGSGAGGDGRKTLLQTTDQAVGFFRDMLKHPEQGRVAREYLERRGVSPEMVAAFQLGYAPDGWDGLSRAIDAKRWNRRSFFDVGLLKQKQGGSGSGYDALRHRLVFPISDALGRPIAFGGRKLRDEDEPKYLNSPETPLFNKSETLFGLHLAKKPMIDAREVVVVEGYTDVIACHQHGATNVVAALGTSLTDGHARVLRRFADRVVLVMDGDAAGVKAADRAVEVFLGQELDVAIAVLPGGSDPDELLRGDGGLDAWNQAIASAKDAIEFLLDGWSSELDQTPTVTGRERLANQFLDRLGRLGLERTGAIRRNWVIQRVAERLGLPESAVQQQLTQARPGPRSRRPGGLTDGSAQVKQNLDADPLASEKSGVKVPKVFKAERELIGILINHCEYWTQEIEPGLTLDEALDPSRIVHAPHQRVYGLMVEKMLDGQTPSATGLLAELAELGQTDASDWVSEAVSKTAAQAEDPERARTVLAGAARTILEHHDQAEYHERKTDWHQTSPQDQALKIQGLMDRLKTNRSPTRIARPRS